MAEWFIVVVSREVGYGEGGGYEYSEPAGVVGPFPDRDTAVAYDRKHYVRDRNVDTDIMRFTPPGGDVFNTKYGLDQVSDPSPGDV